MASPDPFYEQSRDQSGLWMPKLEAGQLLFKRRYELIGPLGAGGMGLVWQARDTLEGSVCALKFLPGLIALQPREMDRLREEVRIGKELRHPRLAATATFGLEEEDSLAAIVMQYVPGETLRDKLETHPRGFFEPEEISGWLIDILDGLGYLHGEAKRVHRDIKPANIMIDADNRARLLDFGISHRIQESLTRHSKTGDKGGGGEAGGSGSTLAYASPQQLSGRPGTVADDLYSFGALVYELLTGTPPYFRGDHDIICHQINNVPLTPLMKRRQELVAEGNNKSVGTAIPKRWEALVKTCLAKEREFRPRSAEVLAGQISQPGHLASHPGPPPVQPSSREASPLNPISVAAALVLLLAAALWGWRNHSVADKPEAAPAPQPVVVSTPAEPVPAPRESATEPPLKEAKPGMLLPPASTSDVSLPLLPVPAVIPVHQKFISREIWGHSDSIRSVAFSPDGRMLASGSLDNTVILWDVATAQPLARLIQNGEDWLALTPEGFYSGPEEKVDQLVCFVPRSPADPMPTGDEIRQLRAYYHQPDRVRQTLQSITAGSR